MSVKYSKHTSMTIYASDLALLTMCAL